MRFRPGDLLFAACVLLRASPGFAADSVFSDGFETALQGFGAATQGAASSPTGYSVYHVTSLADSGPGTLRDAVSAGSRYVVFDVGGTITLGSTLNVRYSYITIDGSTAPPPGITIQQTGSIATTIEARPSTGAAHDIVIRYLRMKGPAVGHLNDGDIWGLDGESAPVYNIVIDHVTANGSADGVFDFWGDVRDVTLSWNLITNTVTALHLSTGDLDQIRRRISIHHNVFAGNNERQIRIRHDNQLIDFVNNVIYGWGWFEGGASGLDIAYDSGETNPSLNVHHNVYEYVPGLSGEPEDAVFFDRGPAEGQVNFTGNLLPAGETDAVSSGVALAIPPAFKVSTWLAATLHALVIPRVGTKYPTAAEQALRDDIRTALLP